MTKELVMNELYKMAQALVKNYSWDANHKMWTLCCDWNSEHPDEEIFMCDADDGFYLEDDHFVFEEV